MRTRVVTRAEQAVEPTPGPQRREHLLAAARHDEFATLTDAVVRMSRVMERLLQMVEEGHAAEQKGSQS